MATKLNWPATLKQSRRYRGRIQLSGMEAMFASRSAVESKFAGLGFAYVRALKPGEMMQEAGTWPTQRLNDNGTWYVEGIWTPSDVTIQNPAPDKLVEAWEM